MVVVCDPGTNEITAETEGPKRWHTLVGVPRMASPGSSGDVCGPPPWSRVHFQLDCPFSAGSSALDSPPPPALPDFPRHDNNSHWPGRSQRTSCEYFVFGRNGCSGHTYGYRVCIHAQPHCETDNWWCTGHPLPAQIYYRCPEYSCAASPCPGDHPMETPTQPFGRGTKKGEWARMGKLELRNARSQKLWAGQDPT